MIGLSLFVSFIAWFVLYTVLCIVTKYIISNETTRAVVNFFALVFSLCCAIDVFYMVSGWNL